MNTKSQNILLLLLVLLNGLVGMGWFLIKDQYEFADTQFFWLLLLIPALSVWYFLNNQKKHADVSISSLKKFSGSGMSVFEYLRHLAPILRMAGLAILVIALARPQDSKSWENRSTEGIDIVIAMDVSASMLAEDFKPNRLEGSKNVAMDFIRQRPDDRIGLVIYEAESFTQVPLTTDHRVLEEMFSKVNTGNLESGTAIGMGLATSVARLKDSDAKSKIVILLSDGENNKGSIQPLDAAQIAQTFGVRVYTIGVGKKGTARAPVGIRNNRYVYDNVEVRIDEETLKEIASMTGGQYFRATNNRKLKSIYEEIDQLEKTRINVTEFSKKTEKYYPFALYGAGLILLGLLLSTLILRTLT
jgi:Ca-activated chloride channel family protein